MLYLTLPESDQISCQLLAPYRANHEQHPMKMHLCVTAYLGGADLIEDPTIQPLQMCLAICCLLCNLLCLAGQQPHCRSMVLANQFDNSVLIITMCII